MSDPRQAAAASGETRMIKVWDPFVRLFHWTLAIGFFVAYFTEDELLTVHVWAGYVVGVLILMRLVWGFAGPKHARFSDFLFAPFTVWRYLIDLIRFRAERHLGHSPAGGAMVFALLIGIAATVWAGLEVYALEENAGPLAISQPVSRALAQETREGEEAREAQEAGEAEDGEASSRDEAAEEFWEETHEVLANLMLAFIIIHIIGVVYASVAFRENLARSMITGWKRAE